MYAIRSYYASVKGPDGICKSPAGRTMTFIHHNMADMRGNIRGAFAQGLDQRHSNPFPDPFFPCTDQTGVFRRNSQKFLV